MSSCLATVSVLPSMADRAQLKRVRSASLSALAEPLKSALKTYKRSGASSPRTPCEIVPTARFPATNDDNMTMTSTRPVTSAIPGCEGLRNAMLFLQNSRQHAMMLMMQNHWERAMTVLEKVENASESVCSQRRKLVLQHANQSGNASTETPIVLTKRAVRFQEEVQVVEALDIDRTPSDIDSPVREEMLVLRASRAIPRANYSELWM